MNRRYFLQGLMLSGAAAGMPKSKLVDRALNRLAGVKNKLTQSSPIQKANSYQSSDFNGDNINRPHEILWNTDGYISQKGGIPQASEHRNVIVVGGGISGLLSTYMLRDMSPLLLEQDLNFGGNSRGESLQDSFHSIGAAYVTIPTEGTEIADLYNELGIARQFRFEEPDQTAFVFNGKLINNFWQGLASIQDAKGVNNFEARLRELAQKAYPEIPWAKGHALSRAEYDQLDSQSFLQWLNSEFPKLPSLVFEYLQKYCWSSFVASVDEVSALQALNFILAEVDGVMTLPGGNAQIAQAIYNKLMSSNAELQSGAFVIRTWVENEKAFVLFEDENGKLQTYTADHVVFAAPKYVARRVVSGLSAKQQELMNKITYRGYLVSNAIFKKSNIADAFDLYSVNGDNVANPTAMNAPKNYTTDVCLADWAQHNSASVTTLTMYRPLPFDGARQFLFSPLAHNKHQQKSLDELKPIMTALGLKPQDLLGIRQTRWGHSVPVARVGALTGASVEQLNQAVAGRIHFANQDNFSNPAFESCFAAALDVANNIRGNL